MSLPQQKADILARLRKEVIALHEAPVMDGATKIKTGLGVIESAFPNGRFPLGAVHEFIAESAEEISAATGFVGSIAGTLMQSGKSCIWVSRRHEIFPPSLLAFGIEPHNIVFLRVQNQKQLLWATEEALRCEGLAAVISEPLELDFTSSRRLQLAVESSRVTGLLLRTVSRNIQTTACMARWRVRHVSSLLKNLPGVGFPRWHVELLRVRNGKPGSWNVEWVDGSLRHVSPLAVVRDEQYKKAV